MKLLEVISPLYKEFGEEREKRKIEYINPEYITRIRTAEHWTGVSCTEIMVQDAINTFSDYRDIETIVELIKELNDEK